jgi:SagB-type dehydrogenase family enzyme
MLDSLLNLRREFLKDTIRQETDFSQTDQSRGIAPPPLEKPFSVDAVRVTLPGAEEWKKLTRIDLTSAIDNRRSRRAFSDEALTLAELSFLLWATQGIRQRLNEATALRTVPSAGARHALETYLCVLHVEGLESALYRYLPLEHELLLETSAYWGGSSTATPTYQEFTVPDARQRLTEATLGQSFVAEAAVTFIWTAIPYRMEWRYGLAAHKVIALDAGHVCQNLYLACEAIGAGTCAVAAYHQQLMDRLVRVDGKDEFVIYLAPVGKVRS